MNLILVKYAFAFLVLIFSFKTQAQQPVPVKPRILISTDIGGTDPDDNQSMIHFLMYSNLFDTEGLISSPSYGSGTKGHILEMLDLYERDLPRLQKHAKDLPAAGFFRNISKQGRQGPAPLKGFGAPTEGSDWIVQCARKADPRPLWVLVWGGLEDVAQALHDDPSIRSKIRVYWIGGPNKKWSANSYAYIVKHFPDLWFIEANSSYQGFFTNGKTSDAPSNHTYFGDHIRNAGYMGKAFKNYYKGDVKMGDTPSLLYCMDGDPNDPSRENWGGSFEKITRSPRRIFNRNTSLADTVGVYAILELHFKGPEVDIPADSACFTMAVKAGIGEQKWPGYYAGAGRYVIMYIPKQTETLSYTVTSSIPGFAAQSGQFVVHNHWPGKPGPDDFPLGSNWYSDRADPRLFEGAQQGAKTVSKWRDAVLLDWARRWEWLR